ncbi:MAG: sugar phosphate nucleotidyltransferase, partial [Rikenellaceae bacterium]
MKIILLSGGSGKRLWPLSNDTRSKQFLKLLKSPDGSYESMVQRIARQITESGIDADITIATSISQYDSIINQLGKRVDVVTEPERRDTFPAIALSAS